MLNRRNDGSTVETSGLSLELSLKFGELAPGLVGQILDLFSQALRVRHQCAQLRRLPLEKDRLVFAILGIAGKRCDLSVVAQRRGDIADARGFPAFFSGANGQSCVFTWGKGLSRLPFFWRVGPIS